ncbi:MAG: GNAT family N-acetyltransferase [Oscillospiraceae bacterium]
MENTVLYTPENQIPDEKFIRLYQIIYRSFPPEEHGSFAQHRAEMRKPEFRCLCCEPDGVPAGFMNYYLFEGENIAFLEHFAMSPELRGNGTGSRLMRYFQDITAPRNIVLEVELPEGEVQRRRIAFYQRMGFALNEGEYFQPAFNPNSQPLPLKLMSTKPLDEQEFRQVTRLIHQRVYGK